MKRMLSLMVLAASVCGAQTPANAKAAHAWAIEVHGGAGTIERSGMTAAQDAAARAQITAAIRAGAAVLEQGGRSLDAVEAALRMMEDSTIFDAGRGSVFNAAGVVEMDAALMDGADLRAGSVAAVTTALHPISLARAVMEQTHHVLLVGAGADAFRTSIGAEAVDPGYFNEERWASLLDQLKKEGRPIPARPVGAPMPHPATHTALLPTGAGHYGTTGVVALDSQGNLAAGTTTGGSQGKLPGRVGDSPIIGAGTYASNHSCAVSGTGVGEYFIRLTVAREICALVQYEHMPVQKAVDQVIHQDLAALGGEGGVIALTPDGQMAWSFNTAGMYRARLSQGSKLMVSIYNDEP